MALYIICFAAGVLITAVIAYLFHLSSVREALSTATEKVRNLEHVYSNLTNEKQHLQNELDTLLSRANKAESQNDLLKQQYEAFVQLQHQHAAAQNQVATLTAQLKYTREKLDNQHNDILRLREQFRLEFSELAQKILDDNSKKFTASNEEKIKQILDPLKNNLSEFKLKVEETYDKESKERFSLEKEVKRLIEMSQLVSHEANNLTTALKGNNKMQGNWGEMILESLLENSGLSLGREYMLQEFIRDASGSIIKDENGKALQPDVTIFYPNKRKIIIDSKVSLISWEQCIGCDNNENSKRFLLEHIRSIRQHIDGLSRKNYPRYALALDYVLLFIPVEPAFLEAVKTDVNLWKYAYDKRYCL